MPPPDPDKEAAELHWQAVAFRTAVEEGDMETVEDFLVEKGFPATYKMEGSNWTVLMIAANAGRVELCDKFVGKASKSMPKPEERDPNGFQAIALAALKGHKEIVALLLEKRAEVNCQDESGETPLMKAAAEGHAEVVQLLLEAGAEPELRDCNGMEAIKKAARWGHAGCLRLLLEVSDKNHRLMQHCMFFGKLNGHDEVVSVMQAILEPSEADALRDAEAAVATR